MPDVPAASALRALAESLAARALAASARIATAESCTGGLIAATLTDVAGSSDWFEAGLVTYALRAKVRLLGVQQDTLDRHGAVSEPTAREMALGALAVTEATHAVAVTGVAGPGGGGPLDPVGTVWVAWAVRGDPLVRASRLELPGDRAQVRLGTVEAALRGLVALLP